VIVGGRLECGGYRGRPGDRPGDGNYDRARGSRRRGLSGGGTLWSGALQLLQSSPPESPARSQWPRARHSGLIHCTVQPGKYCTFLPLNRRLQARPSPGVPAQSRASTPWNDARVFPPWPPGQKRRGKVAGILRRVSCGVKPNIQSLVVVLRTAQLHADHGRTALASIAVSARETFPADMAPALYNREGLHTICPFQSGTLGKLIGGGKAFGCDLGGDARCSSRFCLHSRG